MFISIFDTVQLTMLLGALRQEDFVADNVENNIKAYAESSSGEQLVNVAKEILQLKKQYPDNYEKTLEMLSKADSITINERNW